MFIYNGHLAKRNTQVLQPNSTQRRWSLPFNIFLKLKFAQVNQSK